jgi:4-aminobutyrate aminotransferase / (S)-3-amino-2-methylpropionate transaminase / 5-aminovalerate transaminase
MPTINLKTPIPGPKAQAILKRREAAVTNAVAKATQVVAESATGAVVTDVDGNTLIDIAGGIGMLAAGHCPPAVVNAMKEQAEKLLHMCMIVGTYEPYVELCELLNHVTPGQFPKKTILANSGSEAVENAVKMARCFTKKQGVLVFEGAYHGRTLLTLSMTSKYGLFKSGFGPYSSEIYRLPAPNVYRRPASMTEDEFVQYCMDQLDLAMIAQVDPSALSCIVIEPIQGEAGFVPIPHKFLHKIREMCTKHNIIMIADEIQCGMGRTGKLWACCHSGVVPDLIVSGKSLASGMPIAAVTGRADVMDSPHIGGAGGTYGGAPMACVAAIESIKIINPPEFQARTNEIGEIMRKRLEQWKEKYELVGDVRGVGAMRLVEFVLDRDKKTPAPNETLEIIKLGASRGLILIRAGLYSNGIRFLPPLVITDDQLHEAFDVLELGLAEVNARIMKSREAVHA